MLFNQIRITAPRNKDAGDQAWSLRRKSFQEAAREGREPRSPGGGGAELSTPLLAPRDSETEPAQGAGSLGNLFTVHTPGVTYGPSKYLRLTPPAPSMSGSTWGPPSPSPVLSPSAASYSEQLCFPRRGGAWPCCSPQTRAPPRSRMLALSAWPSPAWERRRWVSDLGCRFPWEERPRLQTAGQETPVLAQKQLQHSDLPK